jgi:hypothetical protein
MARRLAVAAAALLVLLAGATYALTRAPSYESSASVVLVPKRDAPHDFRTFVGGDTIAATAGTYLELLSSPSTLTEAGFRGVHLSASDVPDTSVLSSGSLTLSIDVTTRSRQRRLVQPALSAVIATARRHEGELDDLWDIRTVSSPSAPTRLGPTRGRILSASVLLSLLAALSLSTLIRYFGSAWPARRSPSRSVARSSGGPPSARTSR